uniref:Uncharacterized protein n=1 Tax=Quercus lobata TaxID=97700 RepID=A0A7N2R275_QUELO
MESFVVRENMLYNDHRCGACHNVSDAKVRIKIIVNQDVSLGVYVSYLFTDCVGALYLQPWGLAVGVINAFSSNAPGPIMRLLRVTMAFLVVPDDFVKNASSVTKCYLRLGMQHRHSHQYLSRRKSVAKGQRNVRWRHINIMAVVCDSCCPSSCIFSKDTKRSFSFKPARSVSINRILAAISDMPAGGEPSPRPGGLQSPIKENSKPHDHAS